MRRNKYLCFGVVAAGLATFFITKGDRVTQWFAGFITLFSALNINELGIVIGLLLGISSFILTWVYKHKNHQLLKSQIENGEEIKALLDEDDHV